MYPLGRELAADGIPVTVSFRVLDLARQPYYRWLESPISDAERDDAYLANTIFDAHRDDPEFGHRFLADEARLAGYSVCDRTVWKICSTNGWWCSFAKKKSRKRSSPATAAHDDLVRRVFTADAPNQLWLTDLTEHRTDEGKLYLCAIKDLWSNRIIGLSKYGYMSEPWIGQVNDLLAESRRPVDAVAPGLSLQVNARPSGETVFLSEIEGLPQMSLRASEAVGASVSVPDEVLRSALLEGDFPGLVRAFHEGLVEFEGVREVALYHLYHLYPGGTSGILNTSAMVRALTE